MEVKGGNRELQLCGGIVGGTVGEAESVDVGDGGMDATVEVEVEGPVVWGRVVRP